VIIRSRRRTFSIPFVPIMATTVRVKPSSRVGLKLPPAVPLSTFDMLMPPVYVPLYIIFRPSTSTSLPIQYHALNLLTAYAEVLAYFPLLAGSIFPDESGRLCVHSDNRGADFIYEIRKQKFPGERAEGLAPRSTLPNPNNEDEALLAVKFTSVSDFLNLRYSESNTSFTVLVRIARSCLIIPSSAH
jgi:Transferase family